MNLSIIIILLILLFIILLRSQKKSKMTLVHTDNLPLTEGAFGQGLTYALIIVEYLEKEGIQPKDVIFDIDSTSYGKLIPGMMNPNNNNNNNNNIKNKIIVNDGLLQNEENKYKKLKSKEYFKLYNYLFNKWFSIPKDIFSKVPSFNYSTSLGVHFRGTDKTKDTWQNSPIYTDEFILIIDDFLKKHKNIDTIFAASDESQFIEKINKSFPNIKIIQYQQIRSNNGDALFRKKFNNNDKIINSWVDLISLSRCKYVLKVSSALSSWVNILNPNVEVYQVNSTKQPWYPVGAIPPYNSDNPIIKKILNRTLQGNFYHG